MLIDEKRTTSSLANLGGNHRPAGPIGAKKASFNLKKWPKKGTDF